jgi:hypothetical protein
VSRYVHSVVLMYGSKEENRERGLLEGVVERPCVTRVKRTN